MTDHDELQDWMSDGTGPKAAGEPVGRPTLAPSYDAPVPVATGVSKLMVGVIAGSVLLVMFGVGKMIFGEPAPPKPKVQVQSIWSEQQSIMRDAMKMAREAQQMQKENMARMQAAMEEAEYGGYYEESAVDDSDW
jgi:hypothetical protein